MDALLEAYEALEGYASDALCAAGELEELGDPAAASIRQAALTLQRAVEQNRPRDMENEEANRDRYDPDHHETGEAGA